MAPMEQRGRSTGSLVETAFADFTAASGAVLELLRDRFGFALWTITRAAGEDWILLSVQDEGYGIRSGDVFRWSDSMCSRMVAGLGPNVAGDVSLIPAYAEAPITGQLDIGAYIGVPLTRPDGTVFGTMCAIDPAPCPFCACLPGS
jgi:GAF domain-containing protein